MKNKVFVQFNTVRKILCVILLALMTAVFSGCMQDEPDAAFSESEERTAVKKAAAEEYVLRDNDALYGVRADDSVITMYLTVSGGNEADNSNHTWKEINTYSAYDYEKMNVSRYKVEGILQIDTGDGLTEESFGYGENVPNVSVQIRGQTSSKLEYKSYKIRIKEGKGEFEGQRTLNLNGHYSNPFRFVNKLCFNLLEDIPQTLSLRTQFVQLYVKDLTEGKDSKFVDYGIYSMVEQVNKAYLNNRGFDENGQLYKLSLFEWENEPAVIAPEEDFDLDEFNGAMEMKGNTDRTKLLKTMKPANAANALQEMTADIEYTCKLLLCMKTDEATAILDKCDTLFVARVIQTMHDMDIEWYNNIQNNLLQNELTVTPTPTVSP